MAEPTPMLKQYHKIKQQYSDAIIFFRLGDFYEMFGPDAVISSKILGITLTARYKGLPNEIPMCGIPHHAAEQYLVKLTKAGHKVAICDQVSPAGLGLVERKIIRIVTPGTTLNSGFLEEKINNYVAALFKKGAIWGLSLADVGTGEFQTNETADMELLKSALFRLNPSEIITLPQNSTIIKDLDDAIREAVIHTHQPNLGFNAYKSLTEHFQVKNLHGFGLEKMAIATEAAAILLDYLKDTQKTPLAHFNRLQQYNFADCLIMDESAIRNLELLATRHDNSRDGSLLGIIDDTKTAMGGRLLRTWLLNPLLDAKQIAARWLAVAFLRESVNIAPLQQYLNKITDIERVLGKIGLERANGRDLLGLRESIKNIQEVKKMIPKEASPTLIRQIIDSLNDHASLINLLDRGLAQEPPIEITEGNIIKDGFNGELDELRSLTRDGRDWIKNLTAREIKRTGISSLKIKYNSVFGYYIEVSHANSANVPADYIRKQTLVNAERFITPELKEFEEKILTAEEKIKTLEYNLFLALRQEVATHIPALQKTAAATAALDVLTAFAKIARQNNYVQPVINEHGKIIIKAGRHPVIEKLLADKSYIPNDVYLDNDGPQIILLTGPNMSGKSSYLRQVALITLLAQIGSFVPAQSAKIAIVDRIFTRVGAADNVSRGQSTFMVEMQETANILHNATNRSLIILDELGRGTSTYDGLAIAWAVLEYLHDVIGAKTLFATHYHELIEVATKLPKAKNMSIAVTQHQGQVIFLYQIQEGGTSDSYGIEVARLAGLPRELITNSKKILSSLEDAHSGQLRLIVPARPAKPTGDAASKEILEQLATGDPNSLTPLQAREMQNEIVKKISTPS